MPFTEFFHIEVYRQADAAKIPGFRWPEYIQKASGMTHNPSLHINSKECYFHMEDTNREVDAYKTLLNLETAVGDANLTQSLEPESFAMGRSFTIWECPTPLQSDSNSRSCANLASRTAVSRLNP